MRPSDIAFRTSPNTACYFKVQVGRGHGGRPLARRTRGQGAAASLNSNNMLALISMTVSGLGLTYLPWRCLKPMVDSGVLAKLKAASCRRRYIALYRSDQRSSFIASVTKLAQESCDFSRIFQTDALQQLGGQQEPLPGPGTQRRRATRARRPRGQT
jgi:hypothetical protein